VGAQAGNITKAAAKAVGGGGGGRPDMAQAGGKNPEQLPQALEEAVAVIRQQTSVKGMIDKIDPQIGVVFSSEQGGKPDA